MSSLPAMLGDAETVSAETKMYNPIVMKDGARCILRPKGVSNLAWL